MNNSNLKHYQQTGFDEVSGWCNHALFDVVDYLDNIDFNKSGGCMEIGVYQGKFFILLNSVIDPEYQSLALDIFSDQFLSLDQYGNENLAAFEKNIEKFDAHQGSNVRTVQADSTDSHLVEKFDIKPGYFRFISVDAGHSVQHTVSDLHLANRLVSNEGVVILDDFFHCHWPEVTEGVGRFLDSNPTLVPFAMGYNKLFLSKISWQHRYFGEFTNMSLRSKIVTLYGHKVVVLGSH